MNKRIRIKIDNKHMKRLEKNALKKLEKRYKAYMIKKGPRKGDIIIPGLEDWKIQLEYWGKEPTIIMHPYSIIDSFKSGEAYISMLNIDDELFKILDDIIANKKYHLGCAWGGDSNSQEEGVKKYNDYMEKYIKHLNEVKYIKQYINNYLEDLSKNEYIKEIIVTHSKNNLFCESFGVFVFAKNISKDKYDELYKEISEALKIKKYQPKDEIRSELLLPGKGVSYKFTGIFIGKNEHDYRKRIGKDVYRTYKIS